MPLVVGVAIGIMLTDFDCRFDDNLMGLIESFDTESSMMGFDASERGTIELTALIIAIRGGELGMDALMMFGDKFVD